MQTRQGNVLKSLRTVEDFLNDHADRLSEVVNTGVRTRLTGAITDLAVHKADQSGSSFASQGTTKQQQTLRRALVRDHMVPIARIARIDLPATPEIESLRVPSGRPSIERLAAAANGMAQAAAPHADVFITAGLPVDFVAQLNGAATAMLQSVDLRERRQVAKVGATTGIKSKLTNARKVVHVIDALVQKALQGDDALLSSWKRAKRVQFGGIGTPAVQPPPVPVPAPSPAPASTPAVASAADAKAA